LKPGYLGDDDTVADPSKFDHDQQTKDRRATDESLETERRAADELLEEEHAARAADLVRTGRADAERRLRPVRRAVDDRVARESEILPEVSEKLEDVADSLARAASSLSGVRTLADTVHPARGDVDDLTRVAEELADAAAGVEANADDAPPDAIAGQLAEVADGMADVTSTIADERHDVDHRLRRERAVTDRIIGQELEEVTEAIAEDLRAGQEQLEAERRTTDTRLAHEREHTDEALDHVVDLIELEEAQHAAADRRAATRSEILRIVSHDLRGPLMAIGGAAALIQAHAPGGEPGQRIVDWTLTIRRSVAMMERLIHDLLDAGSFENGTLRVLAKRIDVRDPIRATIEGFTPIAAAKQLTLEADLPGEPVIAQADEHRLMQVLSNLVHNAIKFTPGGGVIRLRAASTDEGCLISVADSGIGIPERELTSIFERFRRLGGGDGTGLGLGLYISQWIVDAHGGRIWAESDVGKGTTISFTLPRPAGTARI